MASLLDARLGTKRAFRVRSRAIPPGLHGPETALIVVGVDFSEGSGAAVTAGRQLAEDRGDPVRMVHVRRDNGRQWHPGPEATGWLRSNDVNPAEVEVRCGVPWVELARAAEELGAHFVVAGTHGSTGFQPFRLGNTASMLALRSRTPVVLAPTRQLTSNGKERR